jgi:cytochrome c peroxidase
VGDDGGLTGRHSMSLANARFRVGPGFFWDERAESLEEQVLMPIQDEVEMNMTLDLLVERMNGTTYYKELFANAFGDEEINTTRIASALAQFVRSLNSFNSRFDEGLAMHPPNQAFSNFTAEENLGKDVFFRQDKGMCASCHSTEAMITDFARNNGLSGRSPDAGLGEVTGNASDFGKFRAPSLRNIAIRPPYMHNGAIQNLGEVVFAYNQGISYSPTLDPHFLAPGGQSAITLNLTPEEQNALIAFMETLTDQDFLTNERYSDPFIR